MPETCLVIGRVIPERKGFKHESLRIYTDAPKLCVIFRVEDGQLIASITGDIGHSTNFTLKSIVLQAEQSWLNAHSFIYGETFEVDVMGVIKKDRNRSDGSAEFNYQDNFHGVIQSRKSQVDIESIWNLCLSRRPLRRALNDLRMALIHIEDGPFYCYRALETIRRDLGGRDHPKNKAAQWEHMWRILGGSQAEKKLLEKLAIDIRHGEDVAYPGAQWRQAITSAWDIVERYVLHLLGGSVKQGFLHA